MGMHVNARMRARASHHRSMEWCSINMPMNQEVQQDHHNPNIKTQHHSHNKQNRPGQRLRLNFSFFSSSGTYSPTLITNQHSIWPSQQQQTPENAPYFPSKHTLWLDSLLSPLLVHLDSL
eukprot:m.1638396 g.1638396  ORF g.1638396 m.1638396 type:complete len:120 (+) comp27872_c0_seq1:266-625(+)